jgi:hypothetical protein
VLSRGNHHVIIRITPHYGYLRQVGHEVCARRSRSLASLCWPLGRYRSFCHLTCKGGDNNEFVTLFRADLVGGVTLYVHGVQLRQSRLARHAMRAATRLIG